MAEIHFVGTGSFWNSWPDPVAKLEAAANFAEFRWGLDVEDDSGNYSLTTHLYTNSGGKYDKVVIPESTLPGSGPLADRREAADEWLFGQHLDRMLAADGIVLLDYYGLDSNDVYGYAWVGTAGQSNHITAVADAYYDGENALPPAYDQVETSGLAYHEMCHLFGAYHENGDTKSNGSTSIMWDWNTVYCSNSGIGDLKKGYLSNCNIDYIRNYHDSNI